MSRPATNVSASLAMAVQFVHGHLSRTAAVQR
jgi:hypothetical protein